MAFDEQLIGEIPAGQVEDKMMPFIKKLIEVEGDYYAAAVSTMFSVCTMADNCFVALVAKANVGYPEVQEMASELVAPVMHALINNWGLCLLRLADPMHDHLPDEERLRIGNAMYEKIQGHLDEMRAILFGVSVETMNALQQEQQKESTFPGIPNKNLH